MSSWIGNDLIDLAAAHNRGRVAQPRLLDRVLCAAEREQLLDEGGCDDSFALLWSAKEAAFKAYQKACPGLVFAPGRWRLHRSTFALGIGFGDGEVQMDDGTRLRARWQRSSNWLHCVAALGALPTPGNCAVCNLAESAPQQPFSADELSGFSRAESGHVRVLARRLLASHGIHDVEIRREAKGAVRGPPRVFVAGVALADIDLSLSHDGEFVAVAISRGTSICSSPG